MNKIFIFLIFSVFLAGFARADIIIDVRDASTEGFNDRTVASPVGGNPGTTIGAQRRAVFERAADILEEKLHIPVDVRVRAEFNSLTCNASYGTLGWAGPEDIEYTLADRTAIPHALYNQLIGEDKEPGYEITVEFNSRIDNNDSCLYDTNWYYGFDEPTGYDISLLTTALHELMHGMGFLSLIPGDGSYGAWWNDGSGNITELFDPFSVQLMDATNGERLIDQTQLQRQQTLRDDGNLVWGGALVNSYQDNFSDGFNNGRAKIYAPSSYEQGSSSSHFDISMFPDETMEPSYTVFDDDPGLAIAALIDIGWTSASEEAPKLAFIGNQVTNEDQRLEIEISASDLNNDTLTFSVSSDEPKLNISLRETTTRVYLVIDPEENFHGEGSVTVTVSDGRLTDEETLTVTVNPVNDLPVITVDETNLRTEEEQPVTFSVTASDVDHSTFTYSIRSLSEDISATVSGSSITLTPSQDKWGNYPFTVSVSDGVGSVSENMMLYVENVNDLPYVDAEGGTTPEDTSWSNTFSYGDVDGRTVTLNANADVADTQLSVSGDGSTGSLEVTPPADFFGDIQITVAVTENSFDVFGTDASPATVTDTFVLTVSSVNDAPTLAQISNKSMLASDYLSVTLNAQDVDNDPLHYSISSNPESLNARISQDQLIIELDGTYIGTASLAITVSDGALSATQSFLIEIGDDNVAPVMQSINDLTGEEDNILSLIAYAQDENADDLTFSVSGLPDWVSAQISPLPTENGLSQASIHIEPSEDAFGEFSFTVAVSDGVLTDSQVVSAHITPVNDAPEFSSEFPTSITMEEDSTKRLTILAIDAESDAYFFSVENAPDTMAARINGNSLILEPERDFNGEVTVTLKVYDSEGSNFHTLNIDVTPVNDRPLIGSISDLTMPFDTTTELTIPLTDIEGDAVVSVSSQYPGLVEAEIIDGVLQLSSPQGYNGQVVITLTIADDEFEYTRSFVVTITGGQPRPEIIVYVDGEETRNGDLIPISTQDSAEPFRLSIYSKVGDWQFSVWYNNEERLDLIEFNSRGEPTILVPSSGAFAGEYEILATDIDEVVPPLSVQFSRPPTYSLNADPLLIGNDQGRIQVRGLIAGQTINATTYSSNLQIFHPIQGKELPAFVLDDPDSQNETDIGLLFPEGTIDNIGAPIDLTMADFPIESDFVKGRKGITHTIRVIDDNQQAIAGASLTLINGNLRGWGINDTQLTNDAGATVLTIPPTELQLHASLDGYHPETLDIAISETNSETTLTLQPRPEFYTLRVKLLANEFDFSNALPEVFIEFEDGESEQVSLTSVTNTTAYADWQWDWSGSVPSNVVIRHEEATEYSTPLDTLKNSERKEAYLWARSDFSQPAPEGSSEGNEAPNPDESTASDSGSSGGGNAAWLLVTALALIGRSRLKTS